MASILTQSAIRRQRDRAETEDLLRVYGSLLTPKQQECISGYIAGKTFSAIALPLGVTRQAVHETVRGVQHVLRWYESKLGLLKSGKRSSASGGKATSTPPPDIEPALERLRSLVDFVGEQEVIYSPEWISGELTEIIDLLGGTPRTRSRASGRKK